MPSAGRMLVTGGAGFIGSHLCDLLIASGNEVRALDDLSTGTESNLAGLLDHPRFTLVRGSAGDAGLVRSSCEWATHVVHLAAAVGVSYVLQHHERAFASNAKADCAMLSTAATRRLPTLYASSSEVYGLHPLTPQREDQPLERLANPANGRAAYTFVKRNSEAQALELHRARGLPVVVARLFNTVGPRQRADFGMVLPRLARQAVRGETLTVYGDGSQTRSFAHVDGVVRALAALLDATSAYGRIVNVGAAREISISELAKQVLAASGSRAGMHFVPLERALGSGVEEPRQRVPDTVLLEALLGWTVPDDLERAIREVVEEQRAQAAAP